MALEHPPPTNATIKQLYARAIECAFPGCREPLFNEDVVSGTWVLNSRICHICARSEGGPRWDEHQSSDNNRSPDNLLLMCPAHSSVIDEPQALRAYPADLLRLWKSEQLAEHSRRSQGWPITGKMADEALAASRNAGISIQGSWVNLGGEGGRAPGAGGGGGGAIGEGASAGRGGSGGRITDADGQPLSTNELERLQSMMEGIEHPAGAGGGGGGRVGPGAIGDDGGDGGDAMTFIADCEAGDVIDMEIGEGGKGAFLPGQHPVAGSDTVIRHKTAAGELIREYRVKGGGSPKVGRVPDDWATISPADLQGGFQVSTLMPVNSYDFSQGRLHVLGAAWERFLVPALPCDVVWQVICIVNWQHLEPGPMRGLQLCLTNPDGEETSRVVLGLPPDALSNSSYIWPLAIGATFDREGLWALHVQSGAYLLSRVLVRVAISE